MATRLGKFTKTPDEAKRYSIEYVHWLDTGEYVEAISFETVSDNTGALVFTPNVIGATDTQVSFFVSGGDDGQTYDVVVTMVTDGGQTKQDELVFVVKE